MKVRTGLPVGLSTLLCLLHLLSLQVDPAQCQNRGAAGQAGEFLRWGAGAKAMGLGRAFTAIADDASALYWNPAGMSSLNHVGGTFMFMHMPMQEGASLNYLAGAVPLRLFFAGNYSPRPFVRGVQELKLGLGVIWHSLGDFELFDRQARSVAGQSAVSADQSAVYISASYPLNALFAGFGQSSGIARILAGSLDLGFTTKFIHQNLFGTGVSATSFDLGLKYGHHSGLFNIGLAWRDLNAPRFSENDGAFRDEIPANAVLGAALRAPFRQLSGLTLSFDFGIVVPSGREHDRMFGLEYDLSTLDSQWPVRLRLGSNSTHEAFTFGISFSPDALIGNDLVPSADWTYGDDRSRFDAVGARYSFSVDRNPFTARYWYMAAESELQNTLCQGPIMPQAAQRRAVTYLRNAESAKNSGKRAFRYEAALRLADIAFISALKASQGFGQDRSENDLRLSDAMQQIGRSYTGGGRRALQIDSGKREMDEKAYFRSFLYYVQSLLLAGQNDMAQSALREQGRSWGRRVDFTPLMEKEHGLSTAFQYLEAFTMYRNGLTAEAIQNLTLSLPDFPAARFLLGHIFFMQGNYQDALDILTDVDLNETGLSNGIVLPFTSDCTFGDEILFLRAASLYRLSEPRYSMAFLTEFANIPRFFPASDLAHFLTRDTSLLGSLTDAYEQHDFVFIETLVNRMIDAYVQTFSEGNLIEKNYSFNLK